MRYVLLQKIFSEYSKANKLKLKLKLIPSMKNQEVDSILTTPASYWEGSCDVVGKKDNKNIKGNAYVELVGYDHRIISEIIKKSVV